MEFYIKPNTGSEITAMKIEVDGKEKDLIFTGVTAKIFYPYGSIPPIGITLKSFSLSKNAVARVETTTLAYDQTFNFNSDGKINIRVTAQDKTTGTTYTLQKEEEKPSTQAELTAPVLKVNS